MPTVALKKSQFIPCFLTSLVQHQAYTGIVDDTGIKDNTGIVDDTDVHVSADSLSPLQHKNEFQQYCSRKTA